ncbi:hypothetical protein [Kordia sp.]|uniref:hypothetical protein n=1 Tax=Kordia sp. TaxID=1965332 RepID=UPI003D6AB33C
MSNIRLRTFYVILFVFFFSCTTQKTILLDNFKSSFNAYIISNNKNKVPEKDTKQFLDNGVKYINSFRDDFFEKIDKKQIQKANLVEIIDQFMDNYYSAALQVEDTVYIYNGYHTISQDGALSRKPSKFEKIDLKTFLTHKSMYGTKSCTIGRMIHNDVDDLLDDVITTRHHFVVYISKITNTNTIETDILRDICLELH